MEIITTDKTEFTLHTCKCYNCGLIRESTFAFEFYPSGKKDDYGYHYLICENCYRRADAPEAEETAKVVVAHQEKQTFEVRDKKEKARKKDIWETI